MAGSLGEIAVPAFQIIEFGKNMEYRIVCEYKKESTIKTVFSNDANFCDRATKNNEIKTIKSESLTTQELEKTKIKGTSALFSRIYRKIDIDNDGKTEDVLNNEELSLGNRQGNLSAGYNYLFITNDYETFKDVPGYGWRHYWSNSFNILFDNDTYYIDMYYRDVSVPLRLAEGKRRISKISKDEEILICEFGQDMKYIPMAMLDKTWKSDRVGSDDDKSYISPPK